MRSALVFPPQNELKSECPHMCAYKLVTVKFRWWGLQTKVENFIHKVAPGQPQRAAPLLQLPSPLFSFFLSFSSPARKTDFHKLSPPAVLLDRQMGGLDHGGHQADGGRDPKRAGGGTESQSGPRSFIAAPSPQMPEAGWGRARGRGRSALTLFPPESHTRCVRRGTCEGPLR